MSNFIIVDSVKGGCGKTLEAIAAAIRCCKECSGETSLKKPVCIVDVDILGTSIERTLVGAAFVKPEYDKTVPIAEKDKAGITQKASVYLNDLAIDEANFQREYVNTFNIEVNNVIYNIGIVISSPLECDRERFRLSSSSNYNTQIAPTHFQGIMRKLIKRLSYEFDTIIFDMPPNSDPYTETIFDELLSLKSDSNSSKIVGNVILEVISTYDAAHISANLEWIKTYVRGINPRWKEPNEMRLILNDVTGVMFLSPDSLVTDIKTYINSEYNKIKNGGKIYYRSYNKELAQHFAAKDKIDNWLVYDSTVDWFQIAELN